MFSPYLAFTFYKPLMTKTTRTLIFTTAAFVIPLSLFASAVMAQQGTLAADGRLPAFTHVQTVEQDLARIDSALNGTGSFSGRFAQYGADGSFAQGNVHLQRPGKVRFEYDDPNPLLIVSDGVTFTQHDKALETYDRVPLSATPLNYFLKENVNLARDTEVVSLQKLPAEWRVTAKDGSGTLDGAITMVFDPATLRLQEWIITDEFGGQTTVALQNLQYNQRMDPRLFILREDSNRRDRRRR